MILLATAGMPGPTIRKSCPDYQRQVVTLQVAVHGFQLIVLSMAWEIRTAMFRYRALDAVETMCEPPRLCWMPSESIELPE